MRETGTLWQIGVLTWNHFEGFLRSLPIASQNPSLCYKSVENISWKCQDKLNEYAIIHRDPSKLSPAENDPYWAKQVCGFPVSKKANIPYCTSFTHLHPPTHLLCSAKCLKMTLLVPKHRFWVKNNLTNGTYFTHIYPPPITKSSTSLYVHFPEEDLPDLRGVPVFLVHGEKLQQSGLK